MQSKKIKGEEENMIEFNPMSNLLEQDQYKYDLQDVAQPNLFRDIYPYDEIPKTSFYIEKDVRAHQDAPEPAAAYLE